MFNVDTAIDANGKTAEIYSGFKHQISPNTYKRPKVHCFSLSLSQAEGSHGYVGQRKLCVSNPCYFEDSSVPTDV